MTRTLYIQTLIDKGACQSQVDLFRAEFGTSVRVTQKLCVEVAAEFNFIWAASNLLSRSTWSEYERVRVPALAEYERVTAPALAEYERVRAPTWSEYERVTAQAWSEYRRVTAPAWSEYRRFTAREFARLYNMERVMGRVYYPLEEVYRWRRKHGL